MTEKKEQPKSFRQRLRPETEVPDDDQDEIVRLHQHYGTREIARRVGWSRKIVRRVLRKRGCSRKREPAPQRSKLNSFHDSIEAKVKEGLTVTRILREIRERGYTGERTILADHARALRAKLALEPRKKVKRRFETRPGKEMQIDWSPYTLLVAGVLVTVHALGCLLCACRKLWVHFYRNERQPILLEGLASAFEYFDGCAQRLVLDNMATAVLGRYGADGKPIWHPRFIDVAKHYGFEPFACKVRDPDRKGKKEKSFRLVWDDFLKGSKFESLDDLNQRAKLWLDHTPEVANQRIHGTTGLVPNEAWLSERDLLIRLPHERFPVYEQSIRVVDNDSTLSVGGRRYTVPSTLANRSVAVRLYAEHFEVLDSHERVQFSRRYVAESDKRKLIIDETHYATHERRQTRGGWGRLDEIFLKRFPTLAPLVSGLWLRMKGLTPVHLRALLRLAESYGEDAFVKAATSAQEYRRFDSRAVERILEHDFQLLEQSPVAPLGGVGAVLLGEVEQGSLDDYGRLDTEATANEADDDSEENHGS
jgi:transposase